MRSYHSWSASFLTSILEIDQTELNLDSVGYIYKTLHEEDEEQETILLHIYTSLFPLSKATLDSLHIFLKAEFSRYRWVFLLDWLRVDKRAWLSDLKSSYEMLLVNSNIVLNEGYCSIVCGEAHHIQNLERTAANWNSYKMEFMNQTLRSFCLLNKCALFAIDKDTNPHDAYTLLKEILGRESERVPEFINLDRLYITWKADSIGKIKTLNENFAVEDVLEPSFIAEKFESLIPSTSDKITVDKDYSNDITTGPPKFDLDAQQELSMLYDKQNTSMRGASNFHKPRSEDYKHKFDLENGASSSEVPPEQSTATVTDTDDEGELMEFLDNIVQRNRSRI